MRFQGFTAASMRITVVGKLPCVVSQKLPNVSEMLTATIIRDHPDDGGSKHLIAMTVQAVSWNISAIRRCATSQKTVIFIISIYVMICFLLHTFLLIIWNHKLSRHYVTYT
jgi:hypothetical protein